MAEGFFAGSSWLWLTSGTLVTGVSLCSPLVPPELDLESVERLGLNNCSSPTGEAGCGQPSPGQPFAETSLTPTVKIVVISVNKSNASNTFMVAPPVRFELLI